jgi:hypothetical protein
MKQKLWSQLFDGDIWDYLMVKEEWTSLTLESAAWDAYGNAFHLSNNRKVAVSKACHIFWHNGVKHQQYYQ